MANPINPNTDLPYKRNRNYQDSDFKKKMSDSKKKQWENPEFRKNVIDNGVKSRKNSLVWNQAQKKRIDEYWENSTDQQKAERSKNISDSMRGNTNGRGNKGKIHSPEQIEAHRKFMTGRSLTQEHKEKISQANFVRWANYSPQEREEITVKMVERNIGLQNNPTKPELAIAETLGCVNIEYKRDMWFWYGPESARKCMNPDFYLPEYDAILEVHGCYWHACDCHTSAGKKVVHNRVESDNNKKEWFSKIMPYAIIWEHEIKINPLFALDNALKSIVDQLNNLDSAK